MKKIIIIINIVFSLLLLLWKQVSSNRELAFLPFKNFFNKSVRNYEVALLLKHCHFETPLGDFECLDYDYEYYDFNERSIEEPEKKQ